MELTFIGCGDAFGTGGRFNTCFHLKGEDTSALIDCGASSLIAMRQQGVDPNDIDIILLTHFHGDHFGGLPFLLFDAQFASRRTAPLTIAGPPGLRGTIDTLREAMFPGSSEREAKFPLTYVELKDREPHQIGELAVTAYTVEHSPNIAVPCYALRVEAHDTSVCYSGDTAWCEALVEAANGVDLFICESYGFDTPIPHHTDFATLSGHLSKVTAKRVILTHLGPAMLAKADDIDYETAEDGLSIPL